MGSELPIIANLIIKTCYNGHVWAGPNWARSAPCPYCSQETIDWKQKRIDELERKISNLKGQITKLRRYK